MRVAAAGAGRRVAGRHGNTPALRLTRCMTGISTAAAAITATIHLCTVISLCTPAISFLAEIDPYAGDLLVRALLRVRDVPEEPFLQQPNSVPDQGALPKRMKTKQGVV